MTRPPKTTHAPHGIMAAAALAACTGCECGTAFTQNLCWGLPGLIQGGFTGFVDWVVGALINAAIYGAQ